MQDKAAIGLHRAAEIHRQVGEAGFRGFVIERDADPIEEPGQVHVGRTIDDDPDRAVCVVFADEGQRAGKIRIVHGRHGDQEVIGEADGFHGAFDIVISQSVPEYPARHDDRPGLVPPRPAQQRPCRPAPGAAGARPRALRLRLRPTILDPLPRRDRRVEFILRAVEELDAALRAMGGELLVRHGDPRRRSRAWPPSSAPARCMPIATTSRRPSPATPR
jgi:hypothetical protein